MVYFERKGCVQRNLYLNCVSRYKKVLKRYRMVRCQVLVIDIGGDIAQSASPGVRGTQRQFSEKYLFGRQFEI